mmetsp:Transcript_51717/g.80745  ORF Transcript_51717/g.80745 Transcript_51717/m.80745 type:complete len:247 (-) Transcript_51717:5-745(-)
MMVQPGDDDTWYEGQVSKIMPNGLFGFIVCKESREVYGEDVFMHSSQLAGLQEGMLVTFQVRLNTKGKPQAISLTQTQQSQPTAPTSTLKATDEEWYVGEVSTIMPNGAFGFVTSDAVKSKYGDDVFLHSSQLPGLQVGMQVTFRIHINAKGRPQAVDLHTHDELAEAVDKQEEALAESSGDDGVFSDLLTNTCESVPSLLDEMCVMTGDTPGVVRAVQQWLLKHRAPVKAPQRVAPPKVYRPAPY